MHKNNPNVNALFGPSGGYESRLEHMNHKIRLEDTTSDQFAHGFGVNFSQPLAHVTNEYITVASGTKMKARRDNEEKRILLENISLIRKLEMYDTLESRARHHALLASPHNSDHYFRYQSSNAAARQSEGDRINANNAELCNRIVNVKASINTNLISKEVAKHDRLVKQISKFRQGKFVTAAASPRALRDYQRRMLEGRSSNKNNNKEEQYFPTEDGVPASPIAGVHPPPLYKCTPSEAKRSAIGRADHTFTPRASPIADSTLLTSQQNVRPPPQPLTGGGHRSPTMGGQLARPSPRLPHVGKAMPKTNSNTNNKDGGEAHHEYVAFSGGVSPPSPRSALATSPRHHETPLSSSYINNPYNANNNTNRPQHPQAWQSPSVVDVRQHYEAVDNTLRVAAPLARVGMDAPRVVSNQAFYRRGEGSITLLGLYKSNSERMEALAKAGAVNNNNNNNKLYRGGPSPPSFSQTARTVGSRQNSNDNNNNNNNHYNIGSATPTTEELSRQNAQYQSEAHNKTSPRKNHHCSSKRNIAKDAAQEHYFTSRSVYARHNDTDPEPADLTLNTVDYGDARLCSKGCFRSHHTQLRDWRAAASKVEDKRNRDNERFSIANQLEIQKRRRRWLDSEEGAMVVERESRDEEGGEITNKSASHGVVDSPSSVGKVNSERTSATALVPRPPQHMQW